ncbi:MAG: lipid II:glycine glycyltransferase FemX [Bacillota bacterium]
MLPLRRISAAERDVFNNFVQASPKAHFLQLYEWGVLKAGTGWQFYPYLLEEGGQPVASALVLSRKVPGTGRSLWYIPRGPVVDFQDERRFAMLMSALKQEAAAHGALGIRIDPDLPVATPSVRENILRAGFKPRPGGLNFEGAQPRFVFRLALQPDLDEIIANFAPKTRYNIRLAGRRGVEVEIGARQEDMAVFYQILEVTAERDGFLVRSARYFDDIWRLFITKGYAQLFMARYQGKIIAATLAFICGDKVWYLYGASSNEHRNVMPNYLLQWEMIRWAKESGCQIYDFRGVSGDLNENNPLYGLYRFKKGFSGDFVEFIGEFDLPVAKLPFWVFNRAEPFMRGVLRRVATLRKRARVE